eukprot:1160679-Pelagomonas_calceolata.AAC.14
MYTSQEQDALSLTFWDGGGLGGAGLYWCTLLQHLSGYTTTLLPPDVQPAATPIALCVCVL